MKRYHWLFTIIFVGVVLASWTSWATAQKNTGSDAASESPNFDFSIFFTGNAQGNIEPCG
ncbi:MAG: hypothetical protein U0V70_06305 [Terriglobia bacterium]